MGLCLGGKYLGCQCGGNGPMHVEDEKVLRMSPADLKKLKDEWKAEDKKKKDEAKRIEELSKTDMRPIGDLVMKEMNRRREVEKEWPQFVSEWRRRKYGDYVDKGIDDVKLITRDIEGEVEEQKKKEQEEELEKAKKLLLGPSIMPVVDVNKKRYDTKDLPDYPKGEKEHHYGTEDLPDYPKTKLREEEESALRHPHRFDRPAFYEDRPLRG
ncbi:hypothetical protein MMC10_008576 [Thelotrema lepadinum]|nr:hypothetical protein [Thelotrema lepadinum]